MRADTSSAGTPLNSVLLSCVIDIQPACRAVQAPEDEVEEEPGDTLSDMDSDEAGMYVASSEEAELKGLLWSTMNRWEGARGQAGQLWWAETVSTAKPPVLL
jgi:hypothetical protein